ncbi:MAG: hypothetical protein HQK78_13855 [Desulfobacterales bacterium]|nr:hypothetical protein [Desulfobacterales bacterium]
MNERDHEYEEALRMKSFLELENAKFKNQLETLTRELEGMDITISSAERYIASYEGQNNESINNIENLKKLKETRISEIDELHLSIKSVKEDKEASLKLNETLKDELSDIIDEKSSVMKKVDAIQNEIDKIIRDKEIKFPNLKWYSVALKKVHKEFVDTQNRMEVAIMFRKR